MPFAVSVCSFELKSKKCTNYENSLLFLDKTTIKIKSNVEDQTITLMELSKDSNIRKNDNILVLLDDRCNITLYFHNSVECDEFVDIFEKTVNSPQNQMTNETHYFQFYSHLSQQQNMMSDYIRTSTYQAAIYQNIDDFRGKVVLDVGAGSGILSFFACQAGASKVYAVEASSMAEHCSTLVRGNGLESVITVIHGKIEEISLPEMVDVIISEPLGIMLFNERMLESYIHSKKFLKQSGRMYPTQGDLYICPFSDEALYMDNVNKSSFWEKHNFYGVDVSHVYDKAVCEYFRQPIVETFDVRILLSNPIKHETNFITSSESDLHEIIIPLHFQITQTAHVHGLAFWFEAAFFGSQKTIWLSTAPTQPPTHWYQVKCLLVKPIFAHYGQTIVGKVVMKVNDRQSYDIIMDVRLDGDQNSVVSNIDLRDATFRSYTTPVIPPGHHNTISPSDQYWGPVQNSYYNKTSYSSH